MNATPPISPFNSDGFTLVELLMAMLIMTVGLLGLLQSLQVAYQHNARNRLREEGVLLAEERMNEFRQMKFDSITASNLVDAPAKRSVAGASKEFTITRDSRGIGDTDSKKLTVTVGWSFKHVTSTHVIYSMKSR